MEVELSGSTILQDVEGKFAGSGFFAIVGPQAKGVTIVWNVIHYGTGGASSTAWTRLYFSTPSTAGRILLFSRTDARFNNYELSSTHLPEAQRTLRLPPMVEGTFLMEYGNDGGASVRDAKLDIKPI